MTDLLCSIINEQLSSVEFVQDYVQLRFDGPCLTCYIWPIVIIGNNAYTIDESGSKDALCKVITHEVKKAVFEDGVSLTLLFDSEYQIKLNLIRNESNRDIPEFAFYQGEGNDWFVLD